MACRDAAAGLLFTVITLATIGLTTGAIVGLYIWATLHHIPAISVDVRIGWIIAIVVSVMFFCFGIYASCCGKRCARCLLGVFFVVYGLGFGALMVLVLADQKGILALLNSADRFWIESDAGDLPIEIQNDLNCLCWNQTVCLNQTGPEPCVNDTAPAGKKECCGHRIDRVFLDSKVVLAIVFGAATVVMLIGAGVAWACEAKKEKERVITYPSLFGSYDNYS
jgi:hypothetical protein